MANKSIELNDPTYRPASVIMIGLSLLDLLVVASTWFVLGFTHFGDGMGPFLDASVVRWSWSTSMFDLAVLSGVRFLVLSVVYWTLRHGASAAHRVLILAVPLASVAFVACKEEILPKFADLVR